jgi:hypothetical protein
MTLPDNELPEWSLDALIARARTGVAAPLTEWRTLSARLRDEGLVRSPGASLTSSSAALPERPVDVWARRSVVSKWSARLMAGAAMLVIGVAIGRGLAAGNPATSLSTREPPRTATESVSHRTFASVEEARQAVLRSQNEYQRAAAYLAATDTNAQLAGTPALYRERLAALDQMQSVTQLALKNAPQDPLLNQYYQSTVGAREATAQQLAQTFPVGSRVSY